MRNNHNITDFASELHWLAFCYVVGELTAEQTIQFEQRLADDLEAQVAVADAVALYGLSYASIETFQDDKVELGRSPYAATGRSSSWGWLAAAVAGSVAIVSLWLTLPGSPSIDEALVKSTVDREQMTNSMMANSVMALSELDLWDRTVEMHQSENPHGDEFEIWSHSSADGSLAGDYSEEYVSAVDGDDGLGEVSDALSVDSDLASIFASALLSFDFSKGEM